MKAIRADALNSIDDYREVEIDPPQPQKGEVLIRVHACGIGYVDALIALGRYQVKPQLPHIPGTEVAGTIEAVGEGVTHVKPGDRVMSIVRGGFAQFATALAVSTAKIPDALGFPQAAGFRVNYLTALHGLRDRAALSNGERLLVMGAAGGVGVAAMQVARALGAHVIAAASTDAKREFALKHGANETIDTAPEGWRDRLKAMTQNKGVDVIFDPVCGPLFESAFRSLSWRGRHLVVGFVAGAIPTLPSNLTIMKGSALVGVDVRQFMLFEPAKAHAYTAELLEWTTTSKIAPPVGQSFAMSEARAALNYALSGKGTGKTVLEIA